jgi:DNA-binding phage protein
MKSVSYKKILQRKLDDPEIAAEYLTACYEEGPEVFLVGLRDVVESHGASVARQN